MEKLADNTAEIQQTPKKKPRGKPFKKGQSGNSKGKPKGAFSLVAILRRELQKVPEGQKITYAEAFIKKLLQKGIIEGDTHSQRLVMNYIEGLPRQPIDIDVDRESLNELRKFFREMATPHGKSKNK